MSDSDARAPRRPLAGVVPELDERELVRRLREGDEWAYEQVARLHGGRLLMVARRFLPEADAQDAVQDAFLSAFRSIGRFDGRSRLSTWLHRIVVNSALMILRRRKGKEEEPLEVEGPDFDDVGRFREPVTRWEESAEALVTRRETRSLVREAIASLPETHRTVLLLRDIEGLTGKEAAERLDITPGAVKVRLHRARAALRDVLDTHLRGAA